MKPECFTKYGKDIPSSIVSEINDTFDISINVNDLLPENFNSVDAILALIKKLQEE